MPFEEVQACILRTSASKGLRKYKPVSEGQVLVKDTKAPLIEEKIEILSIRNEFGPSILKPHVTVSTVN